MKKIKVKVGELSGSALRYAVAVVALLDSPGGRPIQYVHPSGAVFSMPATDLRYGVPSWWSPDTDWAQGGPIIERERIHVYAGPQWTAADKPGRFFYGPTPLIAAMRCYVASRLGDKVEVPEGLL